MSFAYELDFDNDFLLGRGKNAKTKSVQRLQSLHEANNEFPINFDILICNE